jgi:hypothetical protein
MVASSARHRQSKKPSPEMMIKLGIAEEPNSPSTGPVTPVTGIVPASPMMKAPFQSIVFLRVMVILTSFTSIVFLRVILTSFKRYRVAPARNRLPSNRSTAPDGCRPD